MIASNNSGKEALLQRLNHEHHAIKLRIRELDKHISLTSAEQVEYCQLKKQKLLAKDRIQLILQEA